MNLPAYEIFNQFMRPPVKRNDGVNYYFLFNNGDVNRYEFPLPQNLENAIRSKLDSKKYGYSRPQGNSGVCRKIANYEKNKWQNKNITEKNICLTAGVTSGLNLVFQYLDLDDASIIVPAPNYPLIEKIAFENGADIKRVPTKRENEFLPTIDELTSSISSNTKAILLTSPNNPTGSEYSEELMSEVYGLCKDENICLIIDEIFSDLMLNGHKHPTPNYDVETDKIIRLTGWSKDRGVAGFRIGHIVASSDAVSDLGEMISYNYGNPPTVYNNFISKDMTMRNLILDPSKVQENTKEEFEEYERVISGNLKKYELNEKMIFEELGGMRWIDDIVETKGGFCKYIKFKNVEDDVSFAKELYKNTGVLLTPGSGFNSDDKGWMRLTFSVSPQALKQGLNSIASYLN